MITHITSHIPNALSVARICMAGVIAVLIVVPHEPAYGVALIVAAIISDKLDGTLARLMNVESELGKRLESVADPLFSLITGIYLLVHFALPTGYVIYGITLLVLASLGRVLVWKRTGALFYEKSPITRYGVGLGYIIILMYAFEVPYRFEVYSVVMVYGTVMTINYMRMMARALKRARAN